MANEYKLSYTAEEINDKLASLDGVTSNIQEQLDEKLSASDIGTSITTNTVNTSSVNAAGALANVNLNGQWSIQLGNYVEGVGYNLNDVWIG